jgi:hypothetical protein
MRQNNAEVSTTMISVQTPQKVQRTLQECNIWWKVSTAWYAYKLVVLQLSARLETKYQKNQIVTISYLLQIYAEKLEYSTDWIL